MASNLDNETVGTKKNHDNTARWSVHQPVKHRGQSSAGKILAIMIQVLAKIDSPPQAINTPVKKKTEDWIFAKLVCTISEDIPEFYEKTNLRITLQNQINKFKYKANNQVGLLVLQCPTNY